MKPIFFRQLFEKTSSTYSYILGCLKTRDTIIIDPVDICHDRDVRVLKENNLNLKIAINTHCHADHVTGTMKLKNSIGCVSMISKSSTAKADKLFEDNQQISFGERYIKALYTPGHTSGCACFLLDDRTMIFTGDTILIRGCGRTDFQGGSSEDLYDNVKKTVFTLKDDTIIYPAHDYNGNTSTTVWEEKNYNPRLTKSKEEFVNIMKNLNLPYPKLIDNALPLNMMCGV